MERPDRNISFVAPFPPRAEGPSTTQRTPRPWPVDLRGYMESGRSTLHTARQMPTWRSQRQEEGDMRERERERQRETEKREQDLPK